MYVNCVYMRYKDFSVKDKGIFVSGIWFFFFFSEMKLTWLLIFSRPFGITSMNVTTNKHDTCTLHLFWAKGYIPVDACVGYKQGNHSGEGLCLPFSWNSILGQVKYKYIPWSWWYQHEIHAMEETQQYYSLPGAKKVF